MEQCRSLPFIQVLPARRRAVSARVIAAPERGISASTRVIALAAPSRGGASLIFLSRSMRTSLC